MTWYNLKGAAQYTKYSYKTLKRYIDAGKLKYTRIGRQYRFHRCWLDTFMMGYGIRITSSQTRELEQLNKGE